MLQSTCMRSSLIQATNGFCVAAGVASEISYFFLFSFGLIDMAGILPVVNYAGYPLKIYKSTLQSPSIIVSLMISAIMDICLFG